LRHARGAGRAAAGPGAARRDATPGARATGRDAAAVAGPRVRLGPGPLGVAARPRTVHVAPRSLGGASRPGARWGPGPLGVGASARVPLGRGILACQVIRHVHGEGP